MLIDDYFEFQVNFEKKYGNNTLVLMEVGSFFELYGIDNNHEKIGDLKKITELLNIQLTRRNKNILENNRENCLMAGFPNISLNRYLKILVNNNYTVILIEQTSDPPNPKREITRIISPGTDIEHINSDSNCILSIYIEEIESFSKKIFLIGISTIDLSTGISKIMNVNINDYNINSLYEELFRIVEKFNPKEILFEINNSLNINKELLLRYLPDNIIIHLNINNINKNILNNSYQNKILKDTFSINSELSPIEYLDLEKNDIIVISFIILINFIKDHNENILKDIKKPIYLDDDNNLILYNNSIYQLNLINDNLNNKNIKTKYKSLFDVINYTSTNFGKRLLKERLLNPIINIDILNDRYNKILFFKNNEKTDIIIKDLSNLSDLERLNRKIILNILNPFELSNYFISLKYIKSIINNVELILKDDKNIICNFKIKLEKIIEYIENRINLDNLSKFNINNIDQNIFKKNIYENIDKINNEINDLEKSLEDEANLISDLIEQNSKLVKVEYSEKESINFNITKKRYETIQNKLSNNYIIKKNNNNVKITSNDLLKKTNIIFNLKNKLKDLLKEKFIEELININKNYINDLEIIVQYISEIDFLISGAICANENNYTKPKLIQSDKSFIKSKKIRHPIIEKLDNGIKYVENDLTLDKDNNGILLYGINGVGKSSLSKAVGLNIILSQIGYFAACSELELSPYKKIFTRINGDDNLFKGHSSFIVEMLELRSILKYSDKNSIVLGDEICKGTEELSALSIVSSSLLFFSRNNINFIMATHLHKLYEIDNIKNIKNLSFKHLKVNFIDNNIIYDRKIFDGPGESIYGLTVAKNIILEENFLKDSNNIMNNLKENNILKKSKYNSKLFYDKCEICGSTNDLEVHHIIQQKFFNKNDSEKNKMCNLVTLCNNHHNQVHNGNLEIYGYTFSSNGFILNYNESNNKKNRKKYDDNMIKIINSYKNQNLDYVIKKINIEYNIKICKNTVNQIWNNTY